MDNNGTNGVRFISSLSFLATHPLGKLLGIGVVWLISFAFAVGMVRSDIASINERLDRLERAVQHYGEQSLTPR